MSKAQCEQIKLLILDKDILTAELDSKNELISQLRWFCLKLSSDLSPGEELLIPDVARILFSMIDQDVELVSFNEFIDN